MPIKTVFPALMERKMNKEKRDISYREICQETGLSIRTVYLLYKGQGNQFKVIEALCDYFDCEPGELLKRE